MTKEKELIKFVRSNMKQDPLYLALEKDLLREIEKFPEFKAPLEGQEPWVTDQFTRKLRQLPSSHPLVKTYYLLSDRAEEILMKTLYQSFHVKSLEEYQRKFTDNL